MSELYTPSVDDEERKAIGAKLDEAVADQPTAPQDEGTPRNRVDPSAPAVASFPLTDGDRLAKLVRETQPELADLRAENSRIVATHKGLMQEQERKTESSERKNESMRHLLFSSAMPASIALIKQLESEVAEWKLPCEDVEKVVFFAANKNHPGKNAPPFAVVTADYARKVCAQLRDAEHDRDLARGVQASMQAKIDALMLEYCPSEMTRDQRNEWAKHQTPAHDL
jgi:hypothetical protein